MIPQGRPEPPVDMVGNPALEVLFGSAVVAVLLGFVVFTLWSWRKSGSPIGVCMLLGGMIAAFTEPFADFVGLLWFPTQGTLFPPVIQGFGVSVPWWVLIGYSWYLGGMPFIIFRQIQKGTTAKRLLRTALIIMLADVVLEVSGINLGVYTYYGNQPFQVLGMPLWWSMAGGLVCLGMGAIFYIYRDSFKGWKVFLAIPVLPSTYMMLLAFTTWPIWVALDSGASYFITYLAALWAIGLTVLMATVLLKSLRPFLHGSAGEARGRDRVDSGAVSG